MIAEAQFLSELKQKYAYKFKEIDKRQLNLFFLFLKYFNVKIYEHSWNVLACVVGLPRTGKSIFATFTSYLLNKNFNLEHDVVYNYKQFSRRIEEIQNIGETIIWDEAGVGIPAREWYRIQNREIGKMLQTVGHLRPLIFFVTPDFSFIDTQPKKLFHYFFEIPSRKNNYIVVKPFKIKVKRRLGQIHFVYPRILFYGYLKLKAIRFYRPPEEFIKAYEEYANPQKIEIRKKSIKLMEEKSYKKWDISGIKNHIMENLDDFKDMRGKISWKLIYARFSDVLKESGNPQLQAQALALDIEKSILQKQLEEMKKAQTQNV